MHDSARSPGISELAPLTNDASADCINRQGMTKYFRLSYILIDKTSRTPKVYPVLLRINFFGKLVEVDPALGFGLQFCL